MANTITVKGIGKASVAPDLVVLSMNLESLDMNYETAMNKASESIDSLRNALTEAGFEKAAVKTTGFNVNTVYEGIHNKNGIYENVFKGYGVYHNLKLEFGLDSERLTQALSVIGSCLAHPQLSIRFTVKDSSAVNEELLRAAAENARSKAEILCSASGKKLGDLISIDYNWGEHNLYSNTCYSVAEDCIAAPMMAKSAGININPDDIRVNDNVTFVWEIK